MSVQWFTADLHFGYQEPITRGKRPYVTIEDHDRDLIRRWNDVVSCDDEVFVLGDFASGPSATGLDYLAILAGTKHLITGNHDLCWAGHPGGLSRREHYLRAGFASVSEYAVLTLGLGDETTGAGAKYELLLSHFPYEAHGTYNDVYVAFRPRPSHRWLLYGHTHGTKRIDVEARMIHVGVDAWDYTPVSADQIRHLIDTVAR